MNTDNTDSVEKTGNMNDTISKLSTRRDAPKFYFFLLIVLYLATTFIITRVARSGRIIMLGRFPTPVSSFAGAFSSICNITAILLVVFYKKPGLIASLILVLMQFPMIVINMIVRQNFINMGGVFSNLLTIVAIVIIYINNTQIEKFQAGIRKQAVTDRLTGLPNRFACSELMNQLTESKTRFAFVSIDLNNFKTINDTMGHATGNDVLREIASRWRSAADSRATGTRDFITRQGGDEFALIIRDYKSNDDIMKTIRYYSSILESRISIKDYDFYMTASFGYAEFPIDTVNADSLFSYADAAMYQVKSDNSSNHILRFTPDLLREENSLETERKIRTALEKDHVFINLQPQYDMNHKLRCFEALARMRDMQGNLISPSDFIPVAERSGQIDKVDSRVFRKAAEYFGDLIRRTGTDIILSVNVSVRHLMKSDYVNEVRNILRTYGLPARQLELEVTESIMLDSAGKAIQNLNELKKLGVRVAIDDFGTGYSSLSYLKKIPCDLLKIDKSFIDDMNSSDLSRQYVAAIISIGHIMNLEVISEGVETEDQLETLRETGCDYVQGYIWGRPMLPEEAGKLVVA